MNDQYFSPTSGAPEAPVLELSGWWRRVGAQLIDSLILLIPILVLGVIAVVSLAGSEPESSEDFGVGTGIFIVFIFLASFVLPAVYYCWIMPKTNGQTWGKQATGIRVVREDGLPITVGFAFIRQVLVINLGFNLLGGFFLFNLPIIVDYLWPLWDPKNQALHDKIVKSRVVREREHAGVQPGEPAWPVGTPTAPPAPTATPVPYVPPGQQYVAPQAPPTPQFPQQPVQPQAPPPSSAPPPPPPPSGTSTPYTPPPGFENPVPDDEEK